MDTPVLTYKGPAIVARAVLGAGLAGLLLVSGLLPGYAVEWRALLPLLVLGASVWNLPAGYFVTVAALAFPIWQLSPYLMALFIAAAVVPHRFALNHLPLALLIAWAPALAVMRLDLAVVLLAGVLGGVRYGVIAGASAAIWLKLYAAMSGNALDLLTLNGAPGSFSAIAGRFAGAGSLETLTLIGFPFAPNAGELLLNLMQVVAFGAAGGAAGWLAGWGRSRLVLNDMQEPPPAWLFMVQRFAWTALLPAVFPALALGLLLLLLPFAVAHPLSELGLQGALNSFLPRLFLGICSTLAVMAIVVSAQPLPPLPKRVKPQAPAPAPALRQAPQPATPQRKQPARPQLEPLPDISTVKSGRFVPAWAASSGYSALPADDATSGQNDTGTLRQSSPYNLPAGPRDDHRPNEPEIAIEMD